MAHKRINAQHVSGAHIYIESRPRHAGFIIKFEYSSIAVCVYVCAYRYILKSLKYSIHDNQEQFVKRWTISIAARCMHARLHARLICVRDRSALLNFKNIQNHRCFFVFFFITDTHLQPYRSGGTQAAASVVPAYKHVRARKVCWPDLYARVNLIPLTPITVGRIPSHGGMTFLRYTHITRRWFFSPPYKRRYLTVREYSFR